MSVLLLASTFLFGVLRESCIWCFEMDVLSAQSEHPYIAPSRVQDSTLPSSLVSAVGDKLSIAVNGFEHGSDNPCLQVIEHCLQALLEVKEL
jgi:hypothetical protein